MRENLACFRIGKKVETYKETFFCRQMCQLLLICKNMFENLNENNLFATNSRGNKQTRDLFSQQVNMHGVPT